MQPEFWLDRWREGRIGFHQSEVSPFLAKYWSGLQIAADSRVFVPLCGKSLDMTWLAERGHRVLGIELSRIAVEQFFDEHGLRPDVQRTRYGTHYTAGPFELICGDLFNLDATALADCGAFLDRAALIALPPPMRPRYVQVAYAQLPARCRGLLITLDYPQEQKAGPPFSVPCEEVRALFDNAWQLRRLERKDILQDQPNFASEGVTRLHASAYALRAA